MAAASPASGRGRGEPTRHVRRAVLIPHGRDQPVARRDKPTPATDFEAESPSIHSEGEVARMAAASPRAGEDVANLRDTCAAPD